MRRPMRPLRVIVVDGDENAVEGIVPLLLHWDNIFSVTIIQSSAVYPDILGGRDDIVLLDENMDKITGTKIAEWLREDGFPGIIASITSEDACPPAFKYHFPHKRLMTVSFKAAGKFILWLNALIFEVECEQIS